MKWAGDLVKKGLLLHFSSDSMDTMGPVMMIMMIVGSDEED